MTQTTITDEGAFTYQDRTNINANFTDLYSGRGVDSGSTSALTAAGLSTVSSTLSLTYALAAPTIGTSKYIDCTSATANVTVSTTAASCTIGLASSSKTQIVFTAADQVIHLIGETATKWARVSQNSTAITVTT